eukprot:1148048-Pelagomonas_calceolata.AAC.12
MGTQILEGQANAQLERARHQLTPSSSAYVKHVDSDRFALALWKCLTTTNSQIQGMENAACVTVI